jgi:hypothetical protein
LSGAAKEGFDMSQNKDDFSWSHVMTLTGVYLVVMGTFYREGQLSGYGTSISAFPPAITQIHVLVVVAISEILNFILTALQKSIESTLTWLIVIAVSFFAILCWFVLRNLSDCKKRLHEITIDIKLRSKSDNSILPFWIRPHTRFLIVMLAILMIACSYFLALQSSVKRVESFLKNGCDADSTISVWNACISVYDKTDRLVLTGLLLAEGDSKIALFDKANRQTVLVNMSEVGFVRRWRPCSVRDNRVACPTESKVTN